MGVPSALLLVAVVAVATATPCWETCAGKKVAGKIKAKQSMTVTLGRAPSMELLCFGGKVKDDSTTPPKWDGELVAPNGTVVSVKSLLNAADPYPRRAFVSGTSGEWVLKITSKNSLWDLHVDLCVNVVAPIAPVPRPPSPQPIVVLPGLMGSLLEAKSKKAEEFWCPKGDKWFKVWMDVLEMTIDIKCFTRTMSLETNSTGYSTSPEGIEVRSPPDSVYATTCLDPTNALTCKLSIYLKDFYAYMTKKGYTVGTATTGNLVPVAYDWRVGFVNWMSPGGLFSQIKETVEVLSRRTGQKVHLAGHSLGTAVGVGFLNHFVSQQWKDQYIASYISVAGLYGGVPMTLHAVLYGDNDGVALLNRKVLAPVFRTWSMFPMLFPSNSPTALPKRYYPWIAEVGGKKYTIDQLPELMRAFGVDTPLRYNYSTMVADIQSPPRVPVHCIQGVGTPTPYQITYSKAGLDGKYKYINSDGDMKVPFQSGVICADWQHHQSQPVTNRNFTGKGDLHNNLLASETPVWDYILSITCSTGGCK